MKTDRFESITNGYRSLHIAVLGDFCLDRYLEIDPSREEISLETDLPVYNVTKVRSQPGGAGCVLNNIAALGVGTIYPVGFSGEDGEGFELQRALSAMPQVNLDYFLNTPERRTFTYCKPLIMEPGKAPRELNRLDSKNWTPTPSNVEYQIIAQLRLLAPQLDAIAVLDQVDIAETGVVTSTVLAALRVIMQERPELIIIADSRRSLKGFPPFCYKMNRSELAVLTGSTEAPGIDAAKEQARALARENDRNVYVTLSELGILGASPDGSALHVPCHPLRGEIDIVGAGDCVLANLSTASAAGATLEESLEMANAASSIVIHKLGTTGTASVEEIRSLLG